MAGAIVQSPADKKSYRIVTLDNGMTCLLIHDPEIATSLLTAGEGEVRLPPVACWEPRRA